MRPSREESLVATAFVWAQRSTCDRLHVGAVFHREGRILSQGYNGAPAGLPHCNHDCTCKRFGDRWPYMSDEGEVHRFGCPKPEPCLISAHAEQNGIAWAARYGVALGGSQLVTTHQPCLSCAHSIINSGVESVVYVYPYRLKAGLEVLQQAGLVVEQYLDWEEPSVVE